MTAMVADPEGPRSEVVVAANDAPAGHVLTSRDLVVRSMPVQLVPDGGVSTPRTWRGRVLAAPVSAGTVLTDDNLSVAALARQQPAGVVVAYLGLASAPLARAATPGTHVEVLSVADGAVLADDAVVLRVAAGEDTNAEPGVFVAVTRAQARQIAAAGGRNQPGVSGSAVTVALVPPSDSAAATDE